MSKYPVGLIGFRGSLANLKAAIPASCELVAICDINEGALRKWREEDPQMFVTNDYRELAKLDNVATVGTRTPNATHKDIAIACLEGGKHVFIEKPMGINLAEGKQVLEAEAKAGKYVGVDFEYRFSRVTGVEMKNIVDSGELGEILHIDVEHHRGGWTNDTPQGTYRTKRSESGFMKMEGIHKIDFFRYLVGEIESVQSFCAPNALTHYEFPDNFNIIIKFKNGAMGRYSSTHTRSAHSAGKDMHMAPRVGHIQRLGITGSKGSLMLDCWSGLLTVCHFVECPAGSNSLKPELDRQLDFSGIGQTKAFHDMMGCHNEFLDRMAHGREPLQAASDAYISETIANLCDESAYEGGALKTC